MKLLYGVLLLLGLYFVYHFDYESHYLANILDKTSTELNMKIIGFGEGSTKDGQYRFISLSFEIFKPLSQDEIRNLLIDSANKLLKNINSSPNFRGYLANYPFNISNVEIALFLSKPDGNYLHDPDISIAYLKDGILTYLTHDPENEKSIKRTIREKYNVELQ